MDGLRRAASMTLVLLFTASLLVESSSTVDVEASPQGQGGGLRVITLSPAAFVPADSDDAFSRSNTSGLELEAGSTTAHLVARVPLPDNVMVKSLILYTRDNVGGEDICVTLFRDEPANFTATEMGSVCSSGETPVFQSTSTWSIGPQFISAHHDAYLYLTLTKYNDNLAFYGVKIRYQP